MRDTLIKEKKKNDKKYQNFETAVCGHLCLRIKFPRRKYVKRTWKDEWSAQKASTSSPAKRLNQSNDDEEGTVGGLPPSAHPVDIPPPPTAHNALPTEYDRQILNQLRTISQTQMVLKRN